jgi:O-methyltransferase
MAPVFMSDLSAEGASLYLNLLKDCLTRSNFPDRSWNHDLVETRPMDAAERADGRDWPTDAETMVGRARLDSLQHCVTTVIHDHVPGDLVETGVWRGGASILMRAVLKVYGDRDRAVWLADSFEGLPRPAPEEFAPDTDDAHWTLAKYLAVPREVVEANFQRYGLLDEQVKFLPGWFRDTLATAPIERIAVLRLDGDMYESTMLALSTLYPKVSVGGFLIVDDYGALPNCRLAVEDFRSSQGITDPIVIVDWTGAYWRKAAEVGA